MLNGDVRGSLTRDDAQLALRLIARGSDEALRAAEALLRDGGIDALLDDERLAPALVESRAGAHASLPLFFCAVVRQALAALDEHDHGLADYVADVCIRFGRSRSRRAHRRARRPDVRHARVARRRSGLPGCAAAPSSCVSTSATTRSG